jgi:hypothetical protein
MTDFTEDQIKAALIRSNGWNGAGVLNTPLNLTFSFGGTEIPYWEPFLYASHKVKENTFAPLSSVQKTAFLAAIRFG